MENFSISYFRGHSSHKNFVFPILTTMQVSARGPSEPSKPTLHFGGYLTSYALAQRLPWTVFAMNVVRWVIFTGFV